jgi:hypothetical protein
MIRINAQYTDYFDNSDPAYPGGKAVDTTNGDAEDGTPIKKDLVNDLNGTRQAIIVDAYGNFQVSNTPDRVGASDVLNALKIIMNNRTAAQITAQYILQKLLTVDGVGSGIDADLFGGHPPEYYQTASAAGYYIKEISGIEAVIPWSEFGINYTQGKNIVVFICAHGSYAEYKDYVSFPYDVQDDGLHIYPKKLQGGKLVGGSPMRKWGTCLWGEGIEHIPGKKWGSFLWGEGLWAASRTVGGDKWGDFEPMKINLLVKEV